MTFSHSYPAIASFCVAPWSVRLRSGSCIKHQGRSGCLSWRHEVYEKKVSIELMLVRKYLPYYDMVPNVPKPYPREHLVHPPFNAIVYVRETGVPSRQA